MKILCLLLFAMAGVAAAQENATKPTPPFISPLPEHFAFNKKFVYPAAPKDPNVSPEQAAVLKFIARVPKLQELDSVKFGPAWKAVCKYSDGSTAERWEWEGYVIDTQSAQPGQIRAMPMATIDQRALQQTSPDLNELRWVNLDSYSGEQTNQGQKYFVYKKDKQVAWIDEETKLPLVYQSPDFTITYVYKDAPTEPLQIPEEFKKQVEASRRSWRGGPP